MIHRRPLLAALSLLVGLSSYHLEVAFGFSIAPGSPHRGTSAAVVSAAPVSRHGSSSSSSSFPGVVVVPPRIPIAATRSTTTTMRSTGTIATFATVRPHYAHRVSMLTLSGARGGDDYYAAAGIDPSEIIARRIVVTGDVDGGYYRSCVKNEVRVCRPKIRTEKWGLHGVCLLSFPPSIPPAFRYRSISRTHLAVSFRLDNTAPLDYHTRIPNFVHGRRRDFENSSGTCRRPMRTPSALRFMSR